jgi:hypothetical protein
MALQMNTTLNSGVTVENAYFMIQSYSGNREQLRFMAVSFLNRDAAQGNKAPLQYGKEYSCTPDLTDTAKNFIKQGYEYLKTLPEFSGATDVLEIGQIA